MDPPYLLDRDYLTLGTRSLAPTQRVVPPGIELGDPGPHGVESEPLLVAAAYAKTLVEPAEQLVAQSAVPRGASPDLLFGKGLEMGQGVEQVQQVGLDPAFVDVLFVGAYLEEPLESMLQELVQLVEELLPSGLAAETLGQTGRLSLQPHQQDSDLPVGQLLEEVGEVVEFHTVVLEAPTSLWAVCRFFDWSAGGALSRSRRWRHLLVDA